MTIKFIRIGDQLEKGKDQFCFCLYHSQVNKWNIIDFSNDKGSHYNYIFDSYSHFESIFNESSIFEYNKIENFKSIMPPEMLPKEEKTQELKGWVFSEIPKEQKSPPGDKIFKCVGMQSTKPSDEIKKMVDDNMSDYCCSPAQYANKRIDAILEWLDKKLYEEEK